MGAIRRTSKYQFDSETKAFTVTAFELAMGKHCNDLEITQVAGSLGHSGDRRYSGDVSLDYGSRNHSEDGGRYLVNGKYMDGIDSRR